MVVVVGAAALASNSYCSPTIGHSTADTSPACLPLSVPVRERAVQDWDSGGGTGSLCCYRAKRISIRRNGHSWSCLLSHTTVLPGLWCGDLLVGP